VASDCELAVFSTSSPVAFSKINPMLVPTKKTSTAPVMIANIVRVLIMKVSSRCFLAAKVMPIVIQAIHINMLYKILSVAMIV
jgi:hypothetical protein